MPKLDQQIETLQEKLKQLKARQQAIENRQKAIATRRERKADTRRKILIGATVLARIDRHERTNYPKGSSRRGSTER